MRYSLSLCCGLILSLSVTAFASPVEDQKKILEGVTGVRFSGTVGTLLLYGESAFPLAEGSSNGVRYPVVAGSRLEKGRLAAFAHESAMTALFDQNEAFLKNLMMWLAGFDQKSGQPAIAVEANQKIAEALRKRKINYLSVSADNWSQALAKADLIVVSVRELDSQKVAGLTKFLKSGGGVLCGFPGWAWSPYISKTKGAVLKDECPANHLFQQAGIVWTSKTVGLESQTARISNKDSLLETNVLLLLETIADEKKARDVKPQTVVSALKQIGGSLPAADDVLLPRLKKFLDNSKNRMQAPSPQKPVDIKQSQAYLGCLLDAVYAAAAPPEQLGESQMAVPALGPYRRRSKNDTLSATLDTSRPGWHGFGAYAPPGTLVTVKLPGKTVHVGFRIRVGAHSDKLWDKDKLSRPPQLDRVYPVTSTTMKVANAYGGLIYLEAPQNSAVKSVEIEVENVVRAPHYIHGVTDPGAWRDSIRRFPGIWAELETEKVVLTVPSDMIRNLEFPDKLMDHWNEVLDACADLAGIPRERPRAQRVLADVQPSAGWMHSGYPIVTNMRASAQMASYPDMVAQGDWGYYHELGHNHQKPEWTFEGTGEVTCNLFGLYAFDTIHKGRAEHRFADMTKWYEEARQHIAAGAPYDAWKSKPFLALTMYEQMKREFGWEPFKEIFAEYQKMPAEKKPKSDQERRDQWMVRFSRKVGRNLGPFFVAWGVPTTDSARQSISDLPEWMPKSIQSVVSR